MKSPFYLATVFFILITSCKVNAQEATKKETGEVMIRIMNGKIWDRYREKDLGDNAKMETTDQFSIQNVAVNDCGLSFRLRQVKTVQTRKPGRNLGNGVYREPYYNINEKISFIDYRISFSDLGSVSFVSVNDEFYNESNGYILSYTHILKLRTKEGVSSIEVTEFADDGRTQTGFSKTNYVQFFFGDSEEANQLQQAAEQYKKLCTGR